MKDYFKKLKYLFKWRDMLFTLLLFGLILFIAFARADNQVKATLTDTEVSIYCTRYSMNIPYESIDRLELGQRMESQLLKGKGDITLDTGTWYNDTWGEFEACLDLDADNCVMAYLKDGRLFVFSQNDEATTEQLYNDISSHLS